MELPEYEAIQSGRVQKEGGGEGGTLLEMREEGQKSMKEKTSANG